MKKRRWLGRSAVIAGGGLVAAMIILPPAAAAPSDDDIAAVNEQAEDTSRQVAELEVELATNSAELDRATLQSQIAAEDFNDATVELDQAESAAAEAQEALTAANAERDEARAAVAAIAMSAYRNGGSFSQLSMFLEADGITDAINSANTFSVLGTSAEGALQRMEAAEVVASHARENADEAVAEQQVATAALAEADAEAAASAQAAESAVAASQQRRDELIHQLADLRNTSVAMERERQDALDAERRERENAAARAAIEDAARNPGPSETSTNGSAGPSDPGDTSASERPTTAPPTTAPPTTAPDPRPSVAPKPDPTPSAKPSPKPSPKPTPKPDPEPKPPAPSGAGQVALEWAKTQIGKPYVYGAAGPNSYDCSGLTMQAFKRAGINLPRTSRSQYYAGTHVPVDQMKPGDLFFYSSSGPSGIYHVAIYAGNGMRLHAPSAGKTVELVPMYWTNVLPQAVRF
ncbi:hypothetical protein GCG21_00030 [Pseudactinotalea sp. HY160]|uniref:C40 family peptidase n=1 Tax=Pseudactinotalea sp. HY160 TaxID=2654490 RepID=UPI00128CE624|nr:hypothetical protein [Pseudactinotalea sp. HY160]